MSDQNGKLDERALRTPAFQGDVEIVLADGQPWWFPRPDLLYNYLDDSGEHAKSVWNIGEEYGEIVDRVFNEPARFGINELQLGAYLLRRNYALTNHQIGQLLRFNYKEDGSEYARIHDEVMSLAYGRTDAPKASEVG